MNLKDAAKEGAETEVFDATIEGQALVDSTQASLERGGIMDVALHVICEGEDQEEQDKVGLILFFLMFSPSPLSSAMSTSSRGYRVSLSI